MKKQNFYIKFFSITLPIMFQSMATTLVNLVDNIMVGQLGGNAISAVATSNRLFMIITFMLWGIMGASSIFIAQYYGSNKEEEMKQSFRFSLVATMSMMLPLIFIMLLFNDQIARFFVKDEAIVRLIKTYIPIMCIGYIPFTIAQNISSAMRAIGKIKIPVLTTVCGVITNTSLNYLLIFGNFGFPQLGVMGAAIATVTARIVEFLIIFTVYYVRKYGFYTKLKNIFHIEKFRALMIFKKAVPLMINEFAYGVALAMLLKLYATRGANALAAYGIASASTDMFYSAFQGVMNATTILVGHVLGANQLAQAKQNGYKILKATLLIGVSSSIILFLIAPIVPSIYNLSGTIKPEVIQLSIWMIYVICSALWAQYVYIACYMILRVGGDMQSTLMLDAGYMWAVNISSIAIFAYFTNFNVILLMIIGHLTDIIKMFIAIGFVKREKWVVNLSLN